MGAIRVLSGVANLASKSHFSIPCSFRDLTFLCDFFENFQKNIDLKKIENFELNPVFAKCEGNLGNCESCLRIKLLNSL